MTETRLGGGDKTTEEEVEEEKKSEELVSGLQQPKARKGLMVQSDTRGL